MPGLPGLAAAGRRAMARAYPHTSLQMLVPVFSNRQRGTDTRMVLNRYSLVAEVARKTGFFTSSLGDRV
jgi:hypothetical protein